jgi:hypothetical protein
MPAKTIRIFLLLALVLLAVAGGCGKGWSLNDSVEGTVTLDGAPAPNVTVQFVPDDPTTQSPASGGTADDKGHFQLTCQNGKPGAVIGKHNVVVLVGRKDTGGPVSPLVIPAVYKAAAQTPCQVEVTANEHTYQVVLKRNAPARK